MTRDRLPERVPRTSEVNAACAGIDAAADVLERMPNVDPYLVRKLRGLSRELETSRTTHLDRIITWVPDDLEDLYRAISYGGTRQGPGTILRQLERFEELAPVHEPREDGRGYFLMWPDPRIEWIDQARDPEQVGTYPGEHGIYQEVFEAVRRRCQYDDDRSLPEIARHMREQVTYHARSRGAIDDLDEWLHLELPNLQLERTVPRYPMPHVQDDLGTLIDDRLERDPDINKMEHLQRLRREVESWLAALESWWGNRRDPQETVEKTCAQFDEPPPPGWEPNIISSSGGMQIRASDEFLEQLSDLADDLEESDPEMPEDDRSA